MRFIITAVIFAILAFVVIYTVQVVRFAIYFRNNKSDRLPLYMLIAIASSAPRPNNEEMSLLGQWRYVLTVTTGVYLKRYKRHIAQQKREYRQSTWETFKAGDWKVDETLQGFTNILVEFILPVIINPIRESTDSHQEFQGRFAMVRMVLNGRCGLNLNDTPEVTRIKAEMQQYMEDNNLSKAEILEVLNDPSVIEM